MTKQELETTAALRAHALLLETLLAHEIREAAHVAMADPEVIARGMADRFGETVRGMDDSALAGPDAPTAPADRVRLVAALKRELDRVVDGTIARLAKH